MLREPSESVQRRRRIPTHVFIDRGPAGVDDERNAVESRHPMEMVGHVLESKRVQDARSRKH
jgi:hypothetical protein